MPQHHAVRRRYRGTRRIRTVMLCIAGLAFIIGLGLCAGFFMHRNVRLAVFGAVYVLLSAATLSAYGALRAIDRIRKQKYKRR